MQDFAPDFKGDLLSRMSESTSPDITHGDRKEIYLLVDDNDVNLRVCND
jgi:hypothetical protein